MRSNEPGGYSMDGTRLSMAPEACSPTAVESARRQRTCVCVYACTRSMYACTHVCMYACM